MSFNVLTWDFNTKSLVPYDIIPYLCGEFRKRKSNSLEIKNKLLLKDFIIRESRYQFWGRVQYEITVADFPPRDNSKKIDVHYQIMMNIDVITDIVANELKIKK